MDQMNWKITIIYKDEFGTQITYEYEHESDSKPLIDLYLFEISQLGFAFDVDNDVSVVVPAHRILKLTAKAIK